MTQWILLKNCRLTPEEMSRDTKISKRKDFDDAIKAKFGDSLSIPERTIKFSVDNDDFELTFDEVPFHIPEADLTDADGNPLSDCSLANQFINE
mmetsp:Transcript_11395/g.16573  ORF Transcript_11395/g.16573 Transcript_11395/m.16573 type:complete len:94 (+) Transcript_11395:5349-5630(+)